ncbi:MAG: hypothetical protein KF819_40340 [Labilithrix sp.]|nr:hypothetical protein [Labilithrix sp.]
MSPRAVMLVVFGAVGGCSLLTPLGELSSGDDATPIVEGGVEAASPDAGAPDVATIDAEAGADACTQTLCESFDRDEPLTPAWTFEQKGVGPVLEVTPQASVSPPNGLRVAVGPPGSERWSFLARSIAGPVKSARLDYALRVDRAPAVGEVEINIVRFNSGATNHDYYLAITKDSTRFVEQRRGPPGDANIDVPFSPPIPFDKWTRVTFEIDFTGDKMLSVRVDGVEAARRAASFTPTSVVSTYPTVGMNYVYELAGEASVVIDDYVLDLRR